MQGESGESDERLHFTGLRPPSEVADSPVREKRKPHSSNRSSESVRRGKSRGHRRQRFSGLLANAARLAKSDLATEWERGTAFLFIPVFLTIGVITYFSLASEPSFVPLVTGSTTLAAAITLARGKFVIRIGLTALLLVVMGMAAAKLETWRLSTKMLGSEISTHVTGRVAQVEDLSSGRVRLTIDLAGTNRPKLRYAPDRIRVSARTIPPGLHVGDGVTGYVRMLPPTGPVRPASYDFSFQSYFTGIGASGFFLSTPEKVDMGPPPLLERFDVGLEYVRAVLSDHIRSEIGGANGEIAVALVTGMQAGIPDSINEGLRITGVAHVLSISGLHMALVAGIVMAFLRIAFALFPDFSSRHPTKKYAAAVALGALTLYLLISGNGVATQRSYFMLAIMLLAVLLDRTGISMRNFSIAAIIVIATIPHEVTGPSFQMSFAATAALIAAYSAWSEAKQRFPGLRGARRDRSRVGQAVSYAFTHVGGVAMTSLVAGGATALFAAWHFQRISPLGVAGNLATMPVVSFVVMPAMVLAVIAMPFGLDGPLWKLMGWGIGIFTHTSMALSRYSPFDAIGIIPASMLVLMTCGFVILTLASTRLRLAGIPFLLAGLLFLPFRTRPDVLVSEEGRLVGLRLSDGRLAVNSNRPSLFDIENWSHAMMTDGLVKPGKDKESPMPTVAPEVPFSCTHSLCIAWKASGAVVAVAADASMAQDACPIATLLVIDDATANDPCGADGPVVITKRDLARYGAAAVTFRTAPGGNILTSVEYAISKPYRPWHAERSYSRTARGLPPYRYKKRRKKPSADAGSQ